MRYYFLFLFNNNPFKSNDELILELISINNLMDLQINEEVEERVKKTL